MPDVARALKLVPFADPEHSRIHLVHAFARLSPDLAGALPALLAEAPDPDSAILLFDRLLTEADPGVTRLMEGHNFVAHYAITVFGHSRYLGETLLQHPDLLTCLLREKSRERSFSREQFHEALASFRSRSFESDISMVLARFKRRQYVRIMLRDVLKIASLAETTAEISSLSDVLIAEALAAAERELERRFQGVHFPDSAPRPRNARFAILALGKLGGNELNYSSDIDLLYLYGDGGQGPEHAVSTHQYFLRLAQTVTNLLGRATREGPVFRIDLRLRPQGNEGELVVSLSRCLDYYSQSAEDWERQALIKARYCAGDAALARAFLRGVEPCVYSQQVNFSAIKTGLVSREKMHSRRRLAGRTRFRPGIDVKLDRGGIRDIEFLVQCLQRVYGGAEAWLRSSGTLFALHKLYDKQHLSGKEFHDLTSAHEFLRRVEHCLQLRQGQQTHRLPDDSHQLTILRRAVAGYLPAGQPLDDVVSAIQSRMAAVAEIYSRIVYQEQSGARDGAGDREFRLRACREAETAERSDRNMLQQLAADAPAIYELTQRGDFEPEARKNLLRFLSAAFTSSERYGIVLGHADTLPRALRLFATSDYLTDVLVRHVEEIVTLAHLPPQAAGRSRGQLFANISGDQSFVPDPVFAYIVVSDASYEEKLSLLRKHYRQREFASAARDIIEPRVVYESLASTTAAAEEAIAAAFTIAGSPPGLAVLALGRLGSREFDLLSDADLLFVSDDDRDRRALTKAVEVVMHGLAAYTQEGMLFPVDARLRPHGAEGELVVTTKQLHTYFEQEAQAWEALTYTKLRPIAGDRQTAGKAMAEAQTLFARFAAGREFRREIQAMRSKLENSSEASFKSSAGGTYDIDFVTAYLLIANQVEHKNGNLRDRLRRCAGYLAREDAAILDHAAEFMRTLEHVVRLVTGRARRSLPGPGNARARVQSLTSAILRRSFSASLEVELHDTLEQVRSVYMRVLG